MSKPTEDNDKWLPSVFGVWQDSGSKFTGYLPDVDDEVFNYGPVRLWAAPVQRKKYSKFVVDFAFDILSIIFILNMFYIQYISPSFDYIYINSFENKSETIQDFKFDHTLIIKFLVSILRSSFVLSVFLPYVSSI